MYLGGLTRFELAITAVTVRCFIRLSYNPHIKIVGRQKGSDVFAELNSFARIAGIEPATF